MRAVAAYPVFRSDASFLYVSSKDRRKIIRSLDDAFLGSDQLYIIQET